MEWENEKGVGCLISQWDLFSVRSVSQHIIWADFQWMFIFLVLMFILTCIITSFKWYCHMVHCCFIDSLGLYFKNRLKVWFLKGSGLIYVYLEFFFFTLLYVENMKTCYLNINDHLHRILKLISNPNLKPSWQKVFTCN